MNCSSLDIRMKMTVRSFVNLEIASKFFMPEIFLTQTLPTLRSTLPCVRKWPCVHFLRRRRRRTTSSYVVLPPYIPPSPLRRMPTEKFTNVLKKHAQNSKVNKEQSVQKREMLHFVPQILLMFNVKMSKYWCNLLHIEFWVAHDHFCADKLLCAQKIAQ